MAAHSNPSGDGAVVWVLGRQKTKKISIGTWRSIEDQLIATSMVNFVGLKENLLPKLWDTGDNRNWAIDLFNKYLGQMKNNDFGIHSEIEDFKSLESSGLVPNSFCSLAFVAEFACRSSIFDFVNSRLSSVAESLGRPGVVALGLVLARLVVVDGRDAYPNLTTNVALIDHWLESPLPKVSVCISNKNLGQSISPDHTKNFDRCKKLISDHDASRLLRLRFISSKCQSMETVDLDRSFRLLSQIPGGVVAICILCERLMRGDITPALSHVIDQIVPNDIPDEIWSDMHTALDIHHGRMYRDRSLEFEILWVIHQRLLGQSIESSISLCPEDTHKYQNSKIISWLLSPENFCRLFLAGAPDLLYSLYAYLAIAPDPRAVVTAVCTRTVTVVANLMTNSRPLLAEHAALLTARMINKFCDGNSILGLLDPPIVSFVLWGLSQGNIDDERSIIDLITRPPNNIQNLHLPVGWRLTSLPDCLLSQVPLDPTDPRWYASHNKHWTAAALWDITNRQDAAVSELLSNGDPNLLYAYIESRLHPPSKSDRRSWPHSTKVDDPSCPNRVVDCVMSTFEKLILMNPTTASQIISLFLTIKLDDDRLLAVLTLGVDALGHWPELQLSVEIQIFETNVPICPVRLEYFRNRFPAFIRRLASSRTNSHQILKIIKNHPSLLGPDPTALVNELNAIQHLAPICFLMSQAGRNCDTTLLVTREIQRQLEKLETPDPQAADRPTANPPFLDVDVIVGACREISVAPPWFEVGCILLDWAKDDQKRQTFAGQSLQKLWSSADTSGLLRRLLSERGSVPLVLLKSTAGSVLDELSQRRKLGHAATTVSGRETATGGHEVTVKCRTALESQLICPVCTLKSSSQWMVCGCGRGVHTACLQRAGALQCSVCTQRSKSHQAINLLRRQ